MQWRPGTGGLAFLLRVLISLFGASVDQTPPTAADSKVEDHHADLADSILPKSGDLSPWSYSDPSDMKLPLKSESQNFQRGGNQRPEATKPSVLSGMLLPPRQKY
ncbi:hypothetical protein Fcan01_08292 [Folsomia candida]|uniref:Uncharacterized protein n=1 Tax=Folsomia candida TaxID=158441 RepID=A0A226EMH4_FOLCA|nr:hypothetical protein Fcan01_08292 [Folsomia candida]